MFLKRKNKQKGFSFIDIIIGSAIWLIVFIGVVGALRSSIDLVANNKARIGARALANERMEFIRSLAFTDVGTIAGLPSGNIPQSEDIILNSITYTREVIIDNVDAPQDGTGLADENSIPADYKQVKVKVSWIIKEKAKTTALVSNIVPVGIESNEGGGSMIINVFDVIGVEVPNAEITIINPNVSPPVDMVRTMNNEGVFLLSGPEGSGYQVTVTKAGYSTSSTYGTTTEIITPMPEHFILVEGITKSKSFQIDKVSTKMIKSFTHATSTTWEDTFDDATKLGFVSTTTIASGSLILQDNAGSYYPMGVAHSNSISHPELDQWLEFFWNNATSSETDIVYQVLYDDGMDWVAIPNAALPNNETGFGTSPVDLSDLDILTYDEIRLMATLTTTSTTTTPEVHDWGVTYLASIPLANLDFNMRGNANDDDNTKIMGKDAGGVSIYKYDQDLQTDATGELMINNVEWDDYVITVDNVATNLTIAISCPPQPLDVDPNTNVTTSLYMTPYTNYALSVIVRDVGGVLLEGATTRLYKTGYDETKKTGCGQTFFPGLSLSTYSLDISLAGYTSQTINNISATSSTVEVTL